MSQTMRQLPCSAVQLAMQMHTQSGALAVSAAATFAQPQQAGSRQQHPSPMHSGHQAVGASYPTNRQGGLAGTQEAASRASWQQQLQQQEQWQQHPGQHQSYQVQRALQHAALLVLIDSKLLYILQATAEHGRGHNSWTQSNTYGELFKH